MRLLLCVVALLRAAPCTGFTVSQLRASTSKFGSRTTSSVEMAMPRAVVTGMGIVSCIGATLDDVKDSLYGCKSGITFCEEFEEVTMKSRVSGMPTFDWCARIRLE